VDDASVRAGREREATSRAVTLDDIETLVRAVPGTRIGRVKAWANIAPNLAGSQSPGVVAIVIAPAMPVQRPMPSPGLHRAVARYLARRRILGTRFDIVAPEYRQVTVEARVQALPGQALAAVADRVRSALDTFLDPLRGGGDGLGWPFGRDVFRSEVLEAIDQVPGVDHVLTLALVADAGAPLCGNVCLSPFMLTTPGAHRIEVV
jgi:predicted phage baseplate assembly protein